MLGIIDSINFVELVMMLWKLVIVKFEDAAIQNLKLLEWLQLMRFTAGLFFLQVVLWSAIASFLFFWHWLWSFSVPGIIGCLQALEAIKIAASVGEPLSGRMLILDALSGRIRIVC